MEVGGNLHSAPDRKAGKRTGGNNDDYTMYDHWKKRMTIEDWEKEAKEQRVKANMWMSRSCDYGNEIYYIKENLLDASQKEKLAEWEKEHKNE